MIAKSALQVGERAANFLAETSGGIIDFHQHTRGSAVVLFACSEEEVQRSDELAMLVRWYQQLAQPTLKLWVVDKEHDTEAQRLLTQWLPDAVQRQQIVWVTDPFCTIGQLYSMTRVGEPNILRRSVVVVDGQQVVRSIYHAQVHQLRDEQILQQVTAPLWAATC